MPHNLFAMNMMMIMMLMVIDDDLTNLDDAAYLFTFLAHKNLHYLIVSHLSNQRDIFYLVTIQPRSFTNGNNDMHGAQD